MKPQFVFIDYVWPIGMPIRRQFSGGHITDRIASNFKGASREGVGAGEGKQKPVSRQLSDINCQCGQLSVRTTVSADNCQCGQLSVRTTVRSDNCQIRQLAVGQLSVGHGQLSEKTVSALKKL